MAELAVRPAPLGAAGPSASATPAQLYALVDLACAPQLLPLIEWLARSGKAQCLFEGAVAAPLRQVSPHIVALARAPQLLDRWLSEGRGQSWGIFLETPRPMHLARRHVRRFLQVRLPDGSGPVLMRIWDPRVLGPLLDSADADTIKALLPADMAYRVEGDADRIWHYCAVGGSLQRNVGAWPRMSVAASA